MIKFIKKILDDNKENMRFGDWVLLILVVSFIIVVVTGMLITKDPFWITK